MGADAINEIALIETALQRSALDAAGLEGISTEHIARMVVAFDLQPYHLIEKGFIKPGLFHGVAWSHLTAPLSYAAPPTTAPPAEVASAPAPEAMAPPAYPEPPAYTPPAYAAPAPVMPEESSETAPEEAAPAPTAPPAPTATAEETTTTPSTPAPTATPSAASVAEEARAIMMHTLTAEREAEERLRAAQIEADERIARLLISGNAGHVADLPAVGATGPAVTTAYPTLPGADRNVAAGREAEEKLATLNVMGLCPNLKATHRARQLLLEGHNFDMVVTMLSAFNTNRARKEARKAAKKAAKERKRVERAANLAALERCVPGCGCDASFNTGVDGEYWRYQH